MSEFNTMFLNGVLLVLLDAVIVGAILGLTILLQRLDDWHHTKKTGETAPRSVFSKHRK